MEPPLTFEEGGLDTPEVIDLLRDHLRLTAASSPPESVHALDLDGLRQPDVTFWAAKEAGVVVACGALKQLSATHGEIKSMHTRAAHRGRGIGGQMLKHVMHVAQTRGYDRLSLETGSHEPFAPARALYIRFGFVECAPFGTYQADPYSTFMTRTLP